MKKRRSSARGALLAGLATVSLSMTGCDRQPEPVSIVRLGYQHELVTFDPIAHDDVVTRSVLSAIYEPLVRLSRELEIEPCLAERWTTPSPTTWTFSLRPGVRFHDGRPMTMGDVVASLDRALGSPESAVATYLGDVLAVRPSRSEPAVLEIETRGPFPLLLSRLAQVPIAPSDMTPQHPIGTGPYRYVSGTTAGPIGLRRFDGYWGPRAPFDDVRIIVARDDDAVVRLLDGNALDVMTTVTSKLVHRWPVRPPWQLQRMPTLGTTILGMNVLHWPFTDPRVRRALDLAVDREELVLWSFPDRNARPAVSLIPVEAFGFSPTSELAHADREQALRLLRQAGLPPGTAIEIEHAGVQQPTLDYLKTAFEEVGLRVTFKRYQWEPFYTRFIANQSPIYLFGWSFPFADASDLLDSVVHSRDPAKRLGLQNGSGYTNALVDRWIEQASREPRSTRRLELLRKALARVAEDRPYIPLYHSAHLVLAREPFSVLPRSGSWTLPQDVVIHDAAPPAGPAGG